MVYAKRMIPEEASRGNGKLAGGTGFLVGEEIACMLVWAIALAGHKGVAPRNRVMERVFPITLKPEKRET